MVGLSDEKTWQSIMRVCNGDEFRTIESMTIIQSPHFLGLRGIPDRKFSNSLSFFSKEGSFSGLFGLKGRFVVNEFIIVSYTLISSCQMFVDISVLCQNFHGSIVTLNDHFALINEGFEKKHFRFSSLFVFFFLKSGSP